MNILSVNILSEEFFPSRFFSVASWPEGEELHLVINSIEVEEFKNGEKKPALFFKDETKGLVLNKSNTAMLERVFGRNCEGWDGKEVILYCGPNSFNGANSLMLRPYLKPAARRRPPAEAEDAPF